MLQQCQQENTFPFLGENWVLLGFEMPIFLVGSAMGTIRPISQFLLIFFTGIAANLKSTFNPLLLAYI